MVLHHAQQRLWEEPPTLARSASTYLPKSNDSSAAPHDSAKRMMSINFPPVTQSSPNLRTGDICLVKIGV